MGSSDRVVGFHRTAVDLVGGDINSALMLTQIGWYYQPTEDGRRANTLNSWRWGNPEVKGNAATARNLTPPRAAPRRRGIPRGDAGPSITKHATIKNGKLAPSKTEKVSMLGSLRKVDMADRYPNDGSIHLTTVEAVDSQPVMALPTWPGLIRPYGGSLR